MKLSEINQQFCIFLTQFLPVVVAYSMISLARKLTLLQCTNHISPSSVCTFSSLQLSNSVGLRNHMTVELHVLLFYHNSCFLSSHLHVSTSCQLFCKFLMCMCIIVSFQRDPMTKTTYCVTVTSFIYSGNFPGDLSILWHESIVCFFLLLSCVPLYG